MSRIETGGANPSLDAIKTLVDTLKVELSVLIADLCTLYQLDSLAPNRYSIDVINALPLSCLG
jgi:hypothetical protein